MLSLFAKAARATSRVASSVGSRLGTLTEGRGVANGAGGPYRRLSSSSSLRAEVRAPTPYSRGPLAPLPGRTPPISKPVLPPVGRNPSLPNLAGGVQPPFPRYGAPVDIAGLNRGIRVMDATQTASIVANRIPGQISNAISSRIGMAQSTARRLGGMAQNTALDIGQAAGGLARGANQFAVGLGGRLGGVAQNAALDIGQVAGRVVTGANTFAAGVGKALSNPMVALPLGLAAAQIPGVIKDGLEAQFTAQQLQDLKNQEGMMNYPPLEVNWNGLRGKNMYGESNK